MVRNSACQSINGIVEKLSEEDTVSGIMPLVLRLCDSGDFTSIVSSINIMSSIYEKSRKENLSAGEIAFQRDRCDSFGLRRRRIVRVGNGIGEDRFHRRAAPWR